MAGGVDEGYFLIMAGYVEGTDLLGYAPHFTFGYMGFPEVVDEGGLAVIDVTHDGDHW